MDPGSLNPPPTIYNLLSSGKNIYMMTEDEDRETLFWVEEELRLFGEFEHQALGYIDAMGFKYPSAKFWELSERVRKIARTMSYAHDLGERIPGPFGGRWAVRKKKIKKSKKNKAL